VSLKWRGRAAEIVTLIFTKLYKLGFALFYRFAFQCKIVELGHFRKFALFFI